MTFPCLSMLRRVSPFFFFSSHKHTHTHESAARSETWEGNGGIWCVFAITSLFRERTLKRPHEI